MITCATMQNRYKHPHTKAKPSKAELLTLEDRLALRKNIRDDRGSFPSFQKEQERPLQAVHLILKLQQMRQDGEYADKLAGPTFAWLVNEDNQWLFPRSASRSWLKNFPGWTMNLGREHFAPDERNLMDSFIPGPGEYDYFPTGDDVGELSAVSWLANDTTPHGFLDTTTEQCNSNGWDWE